MRSFETRAIINNRGLFGFRGDSFFICICIAFGISVLVVLVRLVGSVKWWSAFGKLIGLIEIQLCEEDETTVLGGSFADFFDLFLVQFGWHNSTGSGTRCLTGIWADIWNEIFFSLLEIYVIYRRIDLATFNPNTVGRERPTESEAFKQFVQFLVHGRIARTFAGPQLLCATLEPHGHIQQPIMQEQRHRTARHNLTDDRFGLIESFLHQYRGRFG